MTDKNSGLLVKLLVFLFLKLKSFTQKKRETSYIPLCSAIYNIPNTYLWYGSLLLILNTLYICSSRISFIN